MHQMNRRTALKTMFAGTLGALTFGADGPLRLVMRSASAQTEGSKKTMIMIFLRGGCDGLNVCVPYGDPNYAGLRPIIGVPAPDPLNTMSALDLNGYFGFNPGLEPIYSLYQAGDIAVCPAVHYEEASRSHFDSQLFIEHGSPDKFSEGYLNRHLQANPVDAPFRAIGMGNSLADSLRGDITVTALESLDSYALDTARREASGCNEYNILEKLIPIYNQTPDPERPNHGLVHRQGKKMFEDIEAFGALGEEDYEPANGAAYPDSGFGRNLKTLAQLIKHDLGLEIATVDLGGWDTHNEQGEAGNPNGWHFRQQRQLAEGLAAFHRDMGGRMSDVTVVVGTEFGRTAQENGNEGTDHGHAATWLVMGGNINGGQVYGDWPGLGPEQLHEGRYLAHTVNYKNIVAEILSNHVGNTDLNTVFPGHLYQPLGIVSA